MSEDDFDFYLRIAGKLEERVIIQRRRRIVGKFGVGFLAVFPFCKIYEIETTRRGSAELIKARINCEKYFTFDENTTIDVDSVPILE
ncbi:MAG: ATP-binding protein [Lewinellaceae bacterium]|nr:ATP-binding protein [Lewinellaceae bacterium]